jgi:hypothetical protein
VGHDEVAPSKQPKPDMNTKFLKLAALAAISFSSVAVAGQSFPIKRSTTGPVAKTDCCTMHNVCKGSDCCATKTVRNGPLGGRGAISYFKRVRTCKSDCQVPTVEQKPVCRKDARA